MHTLLYGSVPLVTAAVLCVLPPAIAIGIRLKKKYRKKMSSAADFVRDARTKLGLSQGELATKLGLERRTVNKYEQRGADVPTTVELAVRYLLHVDRVNRASRRRRRVARNGNGNGGGR